MEQKDELDRLMEESGVTLEFMELWHSFSRVSRSGRRTMEHELEKLGLKPMEVRVLLALLRNGPSTMNALSSETDVTGAWITGVVDELEKRDYVTKTRSLRDRRVINVELTGKGRDALQEGIKVYTRLIEMSLSNLNKDEIGQFRMILQKIEKGLDEHQPL